MSVIMDAHEQKLLALFESCDDYYQGSLSAAGLLELCRKLKLQDSYHKLSQFLVGDVKSKRIYFQDFKEGLIELLDSAESEEKTFEDLSIGKEIPQRHKIGEKKCGRRSRLHGAEFDEFSSDDSGKVHQSQVLSFSTDDHTSDESRPKKRKTRTKSRNSLSNFETDKTDSTSDDQETSPLPNTMNEVEHLVTAWSSISQGVTESLCKDELVRVFQCVGLDGDSEEAAQCVFEKLGLEEHGRITLQELLEFIKTGGSLNKEARSPQMELEPGQKNVSVEFAEHPSLGCVTGGYLVERWECEGVPGSLQLLQNLGYSTSQQIDISSLASLLTEEIKGLSEEFKSSKGGLDPHVALLRASSVLQNLYIHSLKTTIEHLNAEKDKLRSDVTEANQRALFLAQEVDDHHSKLEHSTQQQVKVLEQKHAEKIRIVTNQAKSEQETLIAQNVALEKKLKSLEEEEIKNKSLITQMEAEARLSEQEHRAVVDQLTALQRTKEKLEKDLENVSLLQQKVSEMESALSETDVLSLLERIQALESENTSLRDRNDELSVEVEELSAKLVNSSAKKRSGPAKPVCAEGAAEEALGGGAVKRRGDVFSLMDSAEDSGAEEESPRVGKVRKCSHAKDFSDTTSSFKELQIRGCSGGDCREHAGPGSVDHEDASECKSENSCQIIPFSKELEQVDGASVKAFSFQEDWSCDMKEKLKKIYYKLQSYDALLANEVFYTIKQIVTEKNVGKASDSEEILKARCKELEASLELLKEEYEKTEDYWSEKLEEERSLFEEEQKLSDRKYSELLEKIIEYEETLNAEKEHRQRLETIEEKESFERQVADMEQECAELKFELAEVLKEKELETEKLKSEIQRLKLTRECTERGIQVTDTDTAETDCRSQSDDREKQDGKSLTRQHDLVGKNSSSECQQCRDVKNLLQTKLQFQMELDLMVEERERLYKQVTERKQKLSVCGGNGRVHELEQKCHTLMVTLRQQQKQTEDILKNTWKQHKAEVKDLKSVLRMTEEKLKLQTKVIQEQLAKLAKTDLLVKDLFVENAFLLSSVQKLEKQYKTSAANSKINSQDVAEGGLEEKRQERSPKNQDKTVKEVEGGDRNRKVRRGEKPKGRKRFFSVLQAESHEEEFSVTSRSS